MPTPSYVSQTPGQPELLGRGSTPAAPAITSLSRRWPYSRDSAAIAAHYGITEAKAVKVMRLARLRFLFLRNRGKRRYWGNADWDRVCRMHTAYPHRRRPA